MFRTVFPSIISSVRLYTASGISQTDSSVCMLAFPLECRQKDLFDLKSYAPDDGRKDRPKHVQCYFKINKFVKLVHLVCFIQKNVLILSSYKFTNIPPKYYL